MYVCMWIEYQVVSKILDATMQALWRLHLPSWFVALADSGREAVVEDAAAAVAASAKDNCSALASASSSSNSSLVGAEEGGAGTSLAPLLLLPPPLLLEILCDCDCADPEPALEVPMLSKAFNLASRVF